MVQSYTDGTIFKIKTEGIIWYILTQIGGSSILTHGHAGQLPGGPQC